MKKVFTFCRTNLLLGALTVTWFVIAPPAHAQSSPAPSVVFPDGSIGVGIGALGSQTTNNAAQNTAIGHFALGSANGAIVNVAVGFQALSSTSNGFYNTAVGPGALQNLTTGGNNIGIGLYGGLNLISNSVNNIEIGNVGGTNESNTIRIGDANTQTRAFVSGIHGVAVANAAPVVIGADGQLGTAAALSGQYVLLPSAAPAPAGYTLVGTTAFKYKSTSTGKSVKATLNVYQQN